jgi:hypothetical protein
MLVLSVLFYVILWNKKRRESLYFSCRHCHKKTHFLKSYENGLCDVCYSEHVGGADFHEELTDEAKALRFVSEYGKIFFFSAVVVAVAIVVYRVFSN